MPQCIYGGQKTKFGSQFSPSTVVSGDQLTGQA